MTNLSIKNLAIGLLILLSQTVQAGVEVGEGNYIVFYHHDALGSPTVVTDHNGNTLWHEHNEPYGRTRDRVMPTGKEFLAADKTGDRLGYTGHTSDVGTGLVYMKARFYDPVIGRFYSNDPVGFTASNPMMFNRYAYVNNNPYRYIDPSGKILEYSQELYGDDIEKIDASEFGAEVINDLEESEHKYTIRPPTFGEQLKSFFKDPLSGGRVAGFESSENNEGGTIILTPGVITKGLRVKSWNVRDPKKVTFSADETLFHELGHAHVQDEHLIGDGSQGGPRQSERFIHHNYDFPYTGHYRKDSFNGRLSVP